VGLRRASVLLEATCEGSGHGGDRPRGGAIESFLGVDIKIFIEK
jgi:hypothetical protein